MKNILLIESNNIHAELIQKSLQSRLGKINITTVNSSKTALEVLNLKKFDLILSDYCLPDSKGDILIKQIIKKAPNIPVVIITGQGDEKIAAKTIKAGVEDYIVKTREALEVLPNILQKVYLKFRSQRVSKQKEIGKFLTTQQKRAKKILKDITSIDRRVKILEKEGKRKNLKKTKETTTFDSLNQQIASLKKFIKNNLLKSK